MPGYLLLRIVSSYSIVYKKGQKGKKEVTEQKRKEKEKDETDDMSREEEDNEEPMEDEPEAEQDAEEELDNWNLLWLIQLSHEPSKIETQSYARFLRLLRDCKDERMLTIAFKNFETHANLLYWLPHWTFSFWTWGIFLQVLDLRYLV